MSEPAGLDQFLAGGTQIAANAVPAKMPPQNSRGGSAPPPGLDEFLGTYETPGQIALTGLEGVARGATLGGSDIAETQLGFSTPEAIKGRQEANPGTSFGGNVLGGAGLIGLTGGAAAPAEAALGGGALAHVAGMGLEGALFGAGNAISDAALGDPDLTAGKVLAHIGMGAALGGGLGILSKGIEAAPAMIRSARGLEPVAADIAAPGAEAAQAPVMAVEMKGVQPTSFEQMAKRVEEATKYGGESLELPQAAELDDALSRVEMSNPVHPLQREALENQEKQNLYSVARELPGKEGEAIRGTEAIQKNELVKKTAKTIDDLSPGTEPTPDAAEGGKRAIEAFTDQYQAEKEKLTPLFEALKKTEVGFDVDHLPGVVEKFTDAVPGVARMFDTEAGDFSIKPYKSAWGIDRATYSAVKEAVESLKEAPESFQDLANIRRGLDQHVDVMAQGPAASQIRALKASMMDYMQGALDSQSHNIELRNIFKDYAINEQQREVIEKAFGASVGNKEFGAISKIKPEMIGDKIFSNTATTQAAKDILPPEKFKQILSNWLAEAKEKVTDKGVFSSNKFNTFLRKNQDALNVAFKGNEASLQRLKDLTMISRILPDAPSINPSGTARTLLGSLKGTHDIYSMFKNVAEFAKETFEQSKVRAEVSAALAGKADQAAKMNSIKGIVEKVDSKMQAGAKAIFNSPAAKSGGLSGAVSLTNEEYDEHVKRVKELMADPQSMLDHMSDSTESLYAAAPNITQGIHQALLQGLQYLNSKIPQPSDHMLLSPEWKPSKSQRFKFDTYYRAVNDPLSALQDVKNHSLTGDTMEALTAVHGKLLQEMRTKVLEELKPEEAKKLPYASKLSIAKFIGHPLDQNMTPQGVQINQQALNAPQLSQQSAPQSGRKVNQGGMKQMELAGRVKTRTEGEED